ncbi:MAG: aminopeptidase [Nitrospirales bacterium]|nr:MAG: aminopeptidase [Nitrospirales bacterium]
MRNYLTIIQLIAFLLLWPFSSALGAGQLDELALDINLDLMLKDIEALSSTELEGRQSGTAGGEKSANFVMKRLKHLGLVPAGEQTTSRTNRSWRQQHPHAATKLLEPAMAEFSTVQDTLTPTTVTAKLGSDFFPILDSPSANILAPVLFVGYGIDDPAHGINDYEGIDVHNRIVMFLRGKPEHHSTWVTHEEKEQTARRHGAAGFITLTGPILNRYEARRGMGQAPLAMYSSSSAEVPPLPGVWISGQVGDTLFASQGHSLRKIQAQLNEHSHNQSFELGITAHLQLESTQESGSLINVLGAIPGQDPLLRDEMVIVGAHRDHFGKQAGQLFAGADDNASGTAVLLELARVLTKTKSGPARTIVFISFDGEERGLLGSKLYISQPTHPLNKVAAMINIDHVGAGNGKLTVGITRQSKAIGEQAAKLAKLSEKINIYGFFPGGDHVPFFEAGVPTMTIVSSGKHPFFHQPSDTAETIQAEILQSAAQYALTLTWLQANPLP